MEVSRGQIFRLVTARATMVKVFCNETVLLPMQSVVRLLFRTPRSKVLSFRVSLRYRVLVRLRQMPDLLKLEAGKLNIIS